MSENEATSSSSEATPVVEENVINDEFTEPDAKKRKVAGKCTNKKKNLEDRLGGILCCAVCLDLPRAAVYQVSIFA